MSGFTLTATELSLLQSAYDSLELNEGTVGEGAIGYQDILSDISDPSEPGYPVEGVDVGVYDWFAGALQINEDAGFEGQFVVNQGHAQFWSS